jgi:cytoskeletal protein CcmA (bactofilin family)
MKPIALIPIALAMLSAAALAQETELGGKLRSGQEIVVPAGETVEDDLYASAGTVRIDGRLDGDLIATGGQVTVAGTVTGDVLAAAGTTTISGQVGGDVRAATGQARVQGQVGEDLLLAAGQASVDPGARVGGDLVFAAGRVTMDGTVEGSVLGTTGNYLRRGSVAGSEQVTVQERAEEQRPTVAERLLAGLRRYVSILVVGALLLWLLARVFLGAANAVLVRPLVSFGVGILALIGVVILLGLVILLAVLVAVVLGLAGLGPLAGVMVFGGILVAAVVVFLLLVAVGFGAQAVVGLALGRLLLRGETRSFGRALGALALGVLVVVLLSVVPVAGAVLEALVVLLGLGALVLAMRRGRRRQLVEHPG